MSACADLAANATAGAASALRAVDCLANEAGASAFGRLFGGNGALLPALTILLTLYVGFFAVSLLTGRSRMGVGALTPRMVTLGLVLTFATSWAAWQGVVWNLAVGAPDQLAGILMGTQGISATQVFADRIDLIMGAVAQAADMAGGQASDAAASGAQAAPAGSAGSFTPASLMWLGALLLLLGTVGVLVTARIALGVLLALGPVFVVFGLFVPTRGLTAGWLRGLVLTAVTPLFVVAGGGLMLELLVPVVASLASQTGIDARAALALFLLASVHVALMAMVLRVAGTIVAGWRVFGRPGAGEGQASVRTDVSAPALLPAHDTQAFGQAGRSIVPIPFPAAMTSYPLATTGEAAGGTFADARESRRHATVAGPLPPPLPPLRSQRARGLGSRFAARPQQSREMLR